ncbi:hypothetical protein AJ80_05969 [Polytolypa hystricis UAMH7299]|uniref:Uncharacterized protein n=1 Tax=Polytolypa hystricis (strain UAMH7299) TaxID=1447883 RepID=A0A2B7XZP0_POLH7|nr:hypothetical protein AJ80_05969 [Polytolypa hystricis UAMH7299]
MSHKSGGYFYLSHRYSCPWKDITGQTSIDNNYASAVYSEAQKQDHNAQTQWYKNKAMFAVKADIERNFYPDADRNKQGRTHNRYNENYVMQIEFKWCDKLPVHSIDPLRLQAYGKEIYWDEMVC